MQTDMRKHTGNFLPPHDRRPSNFTFEHTWREHQSDEIGTIWEKKSVIIMSDLWILPVKQTHDFEKNSP